jgi:hypothetical protein
MIADLQANGIVGVEGMAGVEETMAYLDAQPRYPGHVKGASVKQRPGSSTCWAPEDVLVAPYFFEFALELTSVARDYLGVEPLLYSVNAFTTYPLDGPTNPDIQEWHRDRDDAKFLALFVYLTDVMTTADGAHLFKLGSHQGGAGVGERVVLGHAGTAFLADTRGLHMGVRPASRPRTIAWARWGVSDPPPSYVWDGVKPCDKAILGARYPKDKQVQESIRLVVQ